VLDSLHEGCQVIGFDFTYLYVNDTVAAQAKTSKDALRGRSMMECFPGIEHTPMFTALRHVMTERVHHRMENEFTFPDGSQGWFELRFVPVPRGVCILSLDITDQKRAHAALARTEEQLRHAQKMEAVGRLAGGMAHDFNNLLSVILSYTSLFLADMSGEDPLRPDVEELEKVGRRGAELTRQLLAFSRRQALNPRLVDAGQIVLGMEKMLRRLLGAGIELTLLVPPGLDAIRVDPGQLEQVVMNLAVNACDAMPVGGKLTIETRNVVLDEDYAREHLDVEAGAYVMIAVTDTGFGMDKQTQARAFEPFFTTKDRGKGTGLGLATAFGIIKQSGGHIWLYSEPGRGTTFKVYLPRADRGIEQQGPSPVPVGETVRGHETILLVEDDDSVRRVACNILRRNGYRVLEASNGGEALLICEQHGANIHLLLTDLVLPHLSGPRLADRLGRIRPNMKVLFMSGYADEAVLQHGVLESGARYLEKPLTPERLARKVREVLSEG
jgi:PAS domain S-box-containing protein